MIPAQEMAFRCQVAIYMPFAPACALADDSLAGVLDVLAVLARLCSCRVAAALCPLPPAVVLLSFRHAPQRPFVGVGNVCHHGVAAQGAD